ncbi:penicillin binding protein PBP4B [Paenibacillus sp. NPDC058071]|uniref:penicillin binding protein PBP4B n=1 Tax=Paenibacillus sp. NPDC058071 TaxID=3346326 RepID=UPI0036DE1EE3
MRYRSDDDLRRREGAMLIVHYRNGSDCIFDSRLERRFTAYSLQGGIPGKLEEALDGSFGKTLVYTFEGGEPDGSYGFIVKEDRAFGSDMRYVQAAQGKAEIWLIDRDARVFAEPVPLEAAAFVSQNGKRYAAVESVQQAFGFESRYGMNDYPFDGASPGTANLLSIHDGCERLDINVNTNRAGSNITAPMLSGYPEFVFTDIDGYYEDNRYYLSTEVLERRFQFRLETIGQYVFLLRKQAAAYDRLTPADPELVGFSKEKLDLLDAYLREEIAKGFPGLALAVVKDGKIAKLSAYGYAKKYETEEAAQQDETRLAALLPEEQWTPASVETLYDLASNSKMYATNLAVQKLVSEGRLELDRTLQSFPGWERFTDASSEGTWELLQSGAEERLNITPEGKATVTVRDLLHHCAGLLPDPAYPNRLAAGPLWYQAEAGADRSGMIDTICRTPLRYRPRTVFAYSDVGYIILGLLVEQISGMPLDRYAEEHIYAEMGLRHTVFNPLSKGFLPSGIAATELNGNTRDGHVSFGDGVPIRRYTLQGEVHDEKAYHCMSGVSGHAGLFSNAADVGALLQLMLNGGIYNGKRLFSKETVKQFTKPYDPDSEKEGSSTIGLGWRLHSATGDSYSYFNWGPSRSAYGHKGWTGTMTIIDPYYNMGIVILSNCRHSPVVSPPNGFAASEGGPADFIPVTARIYSALMG